MPILYDDSIMSTEYNETLFRYDLDAYGIAVKDKDFKESNIFANRIMSNAALFDSKEFGIIGYILKEISTDGINVQQSKDDKTIVDFSQKTSKVVGTIIKMLEAKQINLKEIWSLYSSHQINTHTLFMSKPEKIAYVKLDQNFSNSVVKQLVGILEKNIGILQYATNSILSGILNETGRISKVYGLTNSDEHFVSLLRMLQRIDDYIKNTSMTDSDFIERTKKEIIPHASEIISIYSSLTDSNDQADKIDILLWELIKIWRLYYIKFMEVIQPSYSIRKQKSTKEDVEKSELVEEVTKYIEDEIGA